MNVRYAEKNQVEKEKKFVHMLNATLCATERTMCCIMENYQEAEGLRIPKVLVPFVGMDFLPYNQEALERFRKQKAEDEKKAAQKAAADAKKGAKGGKKEEKKAEAKEEVKEEEAKAE